MMKHESTNSKHATRVVETRFGRFELEATPKGLYSVRFAKRGRRANVHGMHEAEKHLAQAAEAMKGYCAGTVRVFDGVQIDYSGYTPFQKRVLQELRKIGWGKSRSYQDLAMSARNPRASRAVGSVMRRNRTPILLPCHRILPKSGRLGRYALGTAWKSRFLRHENVGFKPGVRG